MGKITKYLNQLITGSVFDTPEILDAYSTDYSALKIKPKFVALPESTDDIQKLLRFFNQIAAKDIPVSITPRGSGLDESGADLSNGLILSTEKLNRLLEIDSRERLVRVQAGITLKELNTALSVSGLCIPVGGCDSCTIGGLISNNPIDAYYAKYGGIRNFVERIEIVLANGDCLQTAKLKKYNVAKKASEKSLEGDIYRKISKLLKDDRFLLEELSKKQQGKEGYPTILDVSRKDRLDLAPLFFGAQGTLGVVSEVILRAIPLRRKPARAVVTFKELEPAVRFMQEAKEMKPRELNLYDLKIIQEAKETGKNLDGVIRKLEDGYVVYLSFDEHQSFMMRKVLAKKNSFARTTKFITESPENKYLISEVEHALPSYLNQLRNSERVPVLTDFYLPGGNLVSFIKDLEVLEKKLGLEMSIFGSYNNSIYSLRPKFKLDDPEYNKKFATFLRAGAYVINRQEGILVGGSPEGRVKAIVTNAEMLDSKKKFYSKIKKIFDQNDILNPDIKLGANSKFTLTHLRGIDVAKSEAPQAKQPTK